jgi:hypothetical protein
LKQNKISQKLNIELKTNNINSVAGAAVCGFSLYLIPFSRKTVEKK